MYCGPDPRLSSFTCVYPVHSVILCACVIHLCTAHMYTHSVFYLSTYVCMYVPTYIYLCMCVK